MIVADLLGPQHGFADIDRDRMMMKFADVDADPCRVDRFCHTSTQSSMNVVVPMDNPAGVPLNSDRFATRLNQQPKRPERRGDYLVRATQLPVPRSVTPR
ncbi:hypothetical protein OH799_05885 [Nocardia sp. NBC_00881]|uniref:hypothetical protein n=1 Tax=Nocardia sp. NBC_00881 TaxID=2975995 RepID=UPI0038666268|nr:hypothetical protein OH799_05885 [Nocardia sp. NBC_00881]